MLLTWFYVRAHYLSRLFAKANEILKNLLRTHIRNMLEVAFCEYVNQTAI